MKICDECDTVAHCTKHGCIPKVSAKDAMKLALGKIKAARDCHFAAIDTLLFEAEEILEKALAEQPAPMQQEPSKIAELVDALIAKYSDKLFDSVGPHDAAKFEEDCNHIKQALAPQPAQRKPLTGEEMTDGCRSLGVGAYRTLAAAFEAGVRFAEAAHGIKENT